MYGDCHMPEASTKSPQLKLTLEKTDIEQVHEHRVLDVTIDAEMKCYLDLPPYFAQMCVL